MVVGTPRRTPEVVPGRVWLRGRQIPRQGLRAAVARGSLLFVLLIGRTAGDRGHLPDSFQGAGTVVKVAHRAVSGGQSLSLGTADTPARAWACLPAGPLPSPGPRQEMK